MRPYRPRDQTIWTLLHDLDGSTLSRARLRAWSGITGWRFESSSAHRAKAPHVRAFVVRARRGPSTGVTIALVLERVRAAEVIGALSLATDLGMGLPFEHGLQSTIFAARLGERLGLDAETRRHAYYACLLFHSGCTTDAELGAEIFGGSMTRHHLPVMYGSQRESMLGVLRALPPPRQLASPRRAGNRTPDAEGVARAPSRTSRLPARWPRCSLSASACRCGCQACSRT